MYSIYNIRSLKTNTIYRKYKNMLAYGNFIRIFLQMLGIFNMLKRNNLLILKIQFSKETIVNGLALGNILGMANAKACRKDIARKMAMIHA